jgi:nucleotide-binding universal stress UspA family protein
MSMNNTHSNPPRAVILTAVDETTASSLAIDAATRFAALPGSELHFVHVLDSFEAKSRDTALEQGRALLQKIASSSGLGDRATYHLASGTVWRQIVQVAANLHADLIVVGTHDRKPVERMILGSVAEQVVKKALCPVYVARRIAYAEATPEIEPACPACLAVQRKTRGETLWCDRHGRRHVQGHLHYEIPPSFTVGSSLIRV